MQEEEHERKGEGDPVGGRRRRMEHIYIGPNWIMICGPAAHKEFACLSKVKSCGWRPEEKYLGKVRLCVSQTLQPLKQKLIHLRISSYHDAFT